MPDEDPTLVVRFKPETLDDIPLGILRLGTDGQMRYLNRAAMALAGPGIGIGSRLDALHFPSDSEQVLHTEIDARQRSQRGSSYALTLERPDLGTCFHLQISAVPEYRADGSLSGSVGFITDTTMQKANLALHDAIGNACDWQGLFAALDQTLGSVVSCDAVVISQVSADRVALRMIYQRPPMNLEAAAAWRWWPMPAFVKADLDTLLTTRADDVRDMFESEPYRALAETDAATREWLKLGYRHMLRRPVRRGGQLAAIVTVLRLGERPYDAGDIERVEQLPIGEAVNMAVALDHQRELAFGLDLIGHIGAVAGSISEVATVLVDGLRSNFGWEHVSLFRVDADECRVSLVYQSALPGARLDERYSQSIEVGLLGYAARSGQPVRLNDVHQSAEYLQGIAATRSEMCLPVPGTPVRWILNVESSFEGAFAAEEQLAVARLLSVAGLILDRTRALQFNATVLECVADAVIQTSSRGEIQVVNDASTRLLGRARETLVGTDFATLISAPGDAADPPGYAARLLRDEGLVRSEVELRKSDGTAVPVLLSGGALPPQIGGRVYVASDLRFLHEAQRTDALRQVFRQVASELRLPLALASSHLAEIGEEALSDDQRELLDMSMRQLRQADLPLERLIRLAATDEGQELPLRPIALRAVAEGLKAGLPRSQADKVRIQADEDAPPVLAAKQELEFCAGSLLAFLLRMKAEQDTVCVRIAAEPMRQSIAFELMVATANAPSATRLQPKSDHEREFALAEPVIQSLMRRMRGEFEVRQREGLALVLLLKMAEQSS